MQTTKEKLMNAYNAVPTLTQPTSMYMMNLLVNAFECKSVLEQGLFLGGVPMILDRLNPELGLKFRTTETLAFSQNERHRAHYQKILQNRGFDIELLQFTDLEKLKNWVLMTSNDSLDIVPDLEIYSSLNSLRAANSEPFDFIHMDCTDDYDDAVVRMNYMLSMLSEDGIFCVDDFNSAEGFMRALAIGSLVQQEKLWPLACDLRKVYFTRRRNMVERLASWMTPTDYAQFPDVRIHMSTSKVHGIENKFMILVGRR